MTRELAKAPVPQKTALAVPQAVQARAHEHAINARSDNTRRAYASDWRDFEAWCATAKAQSLPASAEAVAYYLEARSGEGLKPATLERRLAAIAVAHKLKSLPSPTGSEVVRLVLEGIRREKGTRQRQVNAITLDLLERMLVDLKPGVLAEIRDRTVLTLGFAGGFRESALVSLFAEDLKFTESKGFTALLRKDKTDQVAAGRTIAIRANPHRPDLCPVLALREWLTASKIRKGPIFRGFYRGNVLRPTAMSAQTVDLIVKEAARRIGLDPTKFTSHSLRAGHVTEALRRKVPVPVIMETTGHRDATTLAEYYREADAFSHGSSGTVYGVDDAKENE